MSTNPPEGAIKIKEETTREGFHFRIFRWMGGKWTEPMNLNQQERSKILSQQKVDTNGQIINEYD